MVYFTKSPYLLAYYDTTSMDGYSSATNPGGAGARAFSGEYYLTVSWVSGPETVSWAMSDQSSGPALPGTNGYLWDPAQNTTQEVTTGHGFRAAFYTCDGCRWHYQSNQVTDDTTYQIGKIFGRQNQSDLYLATHPGKTCTSQASQTMGRSYANEGYL